MIPHIETEKNVVKIVFIIALTYVKTHARDRGAMHHGDGVSRWFSYGFASLRTDFQPAAIPSSPDITSTVNDIH